MATHLYQDKQMEQELLNTLNESLNAKYGNAIPPDIKERTAVEMRHISNNGYISHLAIAATVADYSAACGYHVGIRGMVGNLLIAHLLGITACDPLKLGLRWEGCLGLDGTQMPDIALNAAPEILNGLRAHLRELFPDCNVLFESGMSNRKIVIVPGATSADDSDHEYPHVAIFPDDLMSRVGPAWRKATGMEDFDKDLIVSAYHSTDVYDIPILGDWLGAWDYFMDLARLLEPKSFFDLVKVMGLAWVWQSQFFGTHTPLSLDQFDNLAGTREDIYDICLRHGIGEDDAFRIMWQAIRGKPMKDYRDMLAILGLPVMFLKTLDAPQHIYPRGQCADCMYWVLTILACKSKPYRCRV